MVDGTGHMAGRRIDGLVLAGKTVGPACVDYQLEFAGARDLDICRRRDRADGDAADKLLRQRLNRATLDLSAAR